MTIPSPTLILFGFLSDGFAASSSSTVTPNRRAIFENVSPFATTYVWRVGDGWAVVPALGTVMEGGAGVGLAVMVGLDTGAVALPHAPRRATATTRASPAIGRLHRCW